MVGKRSEESPAAPPAPQCLPSHTLLNSNCSPPSALLMAAPPQATHPRGLSSCEDLLGKLVLGGARRVGVQHKRCRGLGRDQGRAWSCG